MCVWGGGGVSVLCVMYKKYQCNMYSDVRTCFKHLRLPMNTPVTHHSDFDSNNIFDCKEYCTISFWQIQKEMCHIKFIVHVDELNAKYPHACYQSPIHIW